MSFLTHFNRAFDPCSLSARRVSLGPAWNCQMMWSENGRRPFSSSVGCWSDKEIWGSVVFKNRTHTGMKESQPFYPSGGRVKSENRKQSTQEPSVKDTLRNSNKLGRTWKNNEWLRQTILAVCLSQIIWVGKCNASDVKMCNAAIVFTQSPLIFTFISITVFSEAAFASCILHLWRQICQCLLRQQIQEKVLLAIIYTDSS